MTPWITFDSRDQLKEISSHPTLHLHAPVLASERNEGSEPPYYLPGRPTILRPEPSFPSDFVSPSADPPSLMADHSVSSGRGIIVLITRLSTSSISPERQNHCSVHSWSEELARPVGALPNSNYIFLGARPYYSMVVQRYISCSAGWVGSYSGKVDGLKIVSLS